MDLNDLFQVMFFIFIILVVMLASFLFLSSIYKMLKSASDNEFNRSMIFCESKGGTYSFDYNYYGCLIRKDNVSYELYNVYKLNDTDYVLVRK